MTDVDRMTDQEARLREELHRTLVPPPTPASLHQAVASMATERVAREARPRRSRRAALGLGARGLRLAAAAVAVVALVVTALLVVSGREGRDTVGATPGASLPAMVWPEPPPAGTIPTLLESATWLDATAIWARPLGAAAIRMSTDDGVTWSEARPLPVPETDRLEFLDADHGYAMWTDGQPGEAQVLRVHRTADGGRSWQSTDAGALPAISEASAGATVHFSDPDHGLVLGTLRTDAGAQAVPGIPDEPVACEGWITDDGGASWQSIDEAPCLWGWSAWPTAEVGLIVLEDGRMQATVDAGRSWATGSLDRGAGVTFWTRAAVVTSTGAIRLAGLDFDDLGTAPQPLVVLETTDGGASWHEAYRSEAIDMVDVRAITTFDADHWLATARADTEDPMVDGSRFLETTDGGLTWTERGSVRIDTSGGVAWSDPLHGTIQGSRMVRAADGSGEGYITVWITSDGGATWHEVPF